ncbi:MAG: amidophosphoribosyltransferase [Candidatus Micrarchaeia archaeon]
MKKIGSDYLLKAAEDDSAQNWALREECGVVGAFSFSGTDVSQMIYKSLISLQHRGQDSAGMASLTGKKITLVRDLGLVSDVFKKSDLQKLESGVCVGHVRYPTVGAGGPQDAQPFVQTSIIGDIALAHNGNIANYGKMRDILLKLGYTLTSTCDADLILADFVKNIKEVQGGKKIISENSEKEKNENQIFDAIFKTMQELDGSYSVCAFTVRGEFIVFRDPNAIRPLCWGQNKDIIMFASESVALDINSIPLKGDVAPGEALIITNDGITKKIVAKKTSRRHCAFEYVYFSRPDSVQEGKLIYEARMEMGRRLAKSAPVKADIVVAVPDTSRPAAYGYCEESKIPMAEGLMKNRYVGRTFIMPSQQKRMEAIKLKLNAVKQLVQGKRIVLIDDSIVRGTTVGPIVKLLKDAGATQVHLRIACPPVVSPCFYGVDLPTYDELIAHNHSSEEIRKISGADSLAFLSIDDLVASISKSKKDLCLGCLNGEYPTQIGDKLASLIKSKGGKEDIRIWEEKIV